MLELDGHILQKCIQSTTSSVVAKALRERDHLPVVLKSYACDSSGVRPSRAQLEFDALERVHAPGIVRAIELAECGERPVLVLEWIDGIRLDEWVRNDLPSIPAFLEIAAAIAARLEHVHALRLIHRDIKPGNLIVPRNSAPRDVYLIDFGLTKPLGAAERTGDLRSGTGLFNDTLHFMAPEQTGRMARGTDLRSDLYSPRALVYFLLTGHPRFHPATRSS